MFWFRKYNASISQHDKLLYDNIQYLLILVFANKTFWDIDLFEDFWQLSIFSDDNELIFRWIKFVKCLSIQRNATIRQIVSKESLSKNIFDRIVKFVLNFSRYFDIVTIHAIRRYLDKKMNDQLFSISNQLSLTIVI